VAPELRGAPAVNRRRVSTAALLAAVSVVIAGGGAGASQVTMAQRHARTATCARALHSRRRLTKDQVAACTSSTYHVSRCPSGSKVVFITIAKSVDAIVVAHKPISLGKRPGLAALGRACGNPSTPTTTPTTASTTTTTTSAKTPPVVLVPPATTPPLPSTTSSVPVVPASCTPITDEGGCYESGETCPASDYGLTGRAGDGEVITCQDNNGWRWEPT
jgi:hypothetical protein